MRPGSNGPERAGFAALQHAFARHIREPDRHPPPDGIEDRRMGIYRELFYNNVEGFMAGCFPVLREITPDQRWHAMIRDYFAHHVAHTPLFPQMPQEFLQYLGEERPSAPGDPPFLYELAHYEWVEWAMAIDTREVEYRGIDPDGDLLAGRPALSPLILPLAYAWPVHRIGPDYLPDEAPAEPTYLLVSRDSADQVRFMEMNPVTARLVELLGAETGPCGREVLAAIAAELDHPDPDGVVRGGLEILRDLRRREIVLGTRA